MFCLITMFLNHVDMKFSCSQFFNSFSTHTLRNWYQQGCKTVQSNSSAFIACDRQCCCVNDASLLIPWGQGLPALQVIRFCRLLGSPPFTMSRFHGTFQASLAQMTWCCLRTHHSEFAWLLFSAQLHSQIKRAIVDVSRLTTEVKFLSMVIKQRQRDINF